MKDMNFLDWIRAEFCRQGKNIKSRLSFLSVLPPIFKMEIPSNVTSIHQERPVSPERSETLKEEWKKLRDGFENSRPSNKKEFEEKQAFLLRLRRAISWLGRAQQMERDVEGTDKDLDTQFIFLWIGFNALYARDPNEYSYRLAEDQIEKYFRNLCSEDAKCRIYKAIDGNISKEKIRSLSNNEFVSRDFWGKEMGIYREEKDRPLPEPLSELKTYNILCCVFQRLYVLRNQLMHGGATWDGKLNKGQLLDGIKIMHWLLPVFIEIMLENPEGKWGQWGKIWYPRVKNVGIEGDPY